MKIVYKNGAKYGASGKNLDYLKIKNVNVAGCGLLLKEFLCMEFLFEIK